MGKIWIALLCLTSLVSVIFSVRAALALHQYFSLDSAVEASSLAWSVQEKSPSSFALHVSYEFLPAMESEMCSGLIELSKPYFLNQLSATTALEELSKKSWDVFYNHKKPSLNSLQKNFPFKACIQAFLSFAVFIYFIFFKKIVERSLS